MSGNAHVRFGGAGWGNLWPETAAWRPAPTLLQPLTAREAADLLEVVEDRSQLRSTIVTSQLPVSHWHESLGEPTIADAILDRLLHGAHRIELRGDSLRRPQNRDAPSAAETNAVARSRNRAAETPADAR